MTPATLVVLTGGRSARMGSDKAAMDAGGMPLAARPIHALAGLCDDVVLAGRGVPGIDARVVADERGLDGPLAGLVAGVRAARRELCLVVGCDMPAIDPGVAALLLDALRRDPERGAAFCARVSGLLEPLPAAVRTAFAASLAGAVRAGGRALRDGLFAISPVLVPEEAWGACDPSGATFESWNRPEDVRPI